jgi:predicted esterase
VLRIHLIICCVVLIVSAAYPQEKIAKTPDGETVVLDKNGKWYFIHGEELRDGKAITFDGHVYILGKDGKWSSTSDIENPPSQPQKSYRQPERNYSSSAGNLTISYSDGIVSGNASVYVPAGVNTAKPNPLMLLLDPGGNAAANVVRWQQAADRFGWIIASTPAIANGVDSSVIRQHLIAMLEAIASKWYVDRNVVMLEGFSGGGSAAYRQALMHPDIFRGAVVECGNLVPLIDLQNQIRPGSYFYLATRTQDFNEKQMRKLAAGLEKSGETIKFNELSGGHEPISGADATDALEWVNATIR